MRSGGMRRTDRKPILARRQGLARRPYRPGKVGLAHRYRIALLGPIAAQPSAPDHGRIDRTRRSPTEGVDMLSTTIKRTIATALSGAAIAGTIGAPGASAMPIDPLGTGHPGDTQ